MYQDDLISTIKLMVLTNLNRENNLYKVICDIFIVIFFHLIVQNISTYKVNNFINNINYNSLSLIYMFSKKHSVFLEGNKCFKTSEYITKSDKLFSNRFRAFWHYINSNNYNKKNIISVKEYADSCNNEEEDQNDRLYRKSKFINLSNISHLNDIFVINQTTSFMITNDIYCNISFQNNCSDDENRRSKIRIETINVELFSYVLNVNNIILFLDNITNDYNKYIENIRNNKIYIYTYLGCSNNRYSEYDNDRIINKWEECEFKSSRTFENLFFENKCDLINKLDFFKNNRDWYMHEGHPYTLGIGLYGPPGTGKTSIIKCIANRLKRNLIIIPLNKIKTQREFSECYFEKIYNRHNQKNVEFKDKIIVFEDIDCMCDIVNTRESEKRKDKNNELDNIDKNLDRNTKLLSNIYDKLNADKDNQDYKTTVVNIDDKSKNDKITLSYILNIIDGIRETPDRILIITSNYYDKLDEALIRPGRIDISLEMKNTSKDIIKLMYNHYYNNILPDYLYNKIEDYKLSPAKIVNMRLQNSTANEFCKCLEKCF
tara:strand:- start:1243 stop:2877 length:1635 start_codon:yes stop_codon:yes gene_type:complete